MNSVKITDSLSRAKKITNNHNTVIEKCYIRFSSSFC